MTPEELAAAVARPLGDVGGAPYFNPDTLKRCKELGIDGFRFYILGRGGVLGNVEAPVVQSAFGYFSPGLITKMWNSGREIMAPRDAAREYFTCCANLGRKLFGETDGLDEFNSAARALIEAADPAGLALYAGWAAEPLVDDTAGRAMQLAAVIRELRGSAHLAAVLASGLRPREAHALKRPGDVAMFGWPDELPPLDETHQAAMDEAEALTNRLIAHAFEALNETQGADLIAGAKAMHAVVASG